MATKLGKSGFLYVLVLMGFVCFNGCSTSSGDGDNNETSTPTYSGKETSVELSQDNYDAVSEDAYENTTAFGVYGSAMVPPVLAVYPHGTTERVLTYQDLAQLLVSIIDKIQGVSPPSRPMQSRSLSSGSGTLNGTCGGTAQYTFDPSVVDRSFELSVTFDSYCEEGITLNGSISATGERDVAESDVSMSITFTDYSMVYSGITISIVGNMTVTVSLDSQRLTINITYTNSSTKATYKVENLFVTTTTTPPTSKFRISGKFYSPNYGYCAVDTETDFVTSAAVVQSGAMTVSDDGNRKARLTILPAGTYIVELDIDNDGEYEFDTGTLEW